jgi:uncharacterized protein YbjT (DUF2867 family)
MILVVGATGMVGMEVCRGLRSEHERVRGLVRAISDPAKVEALQRLGVETVQGDLRDRASLQSALHNVDTVITTASSVPMRYEPGANTPNMTDRDGYLSLIEAAERAGVRRFVYTSFPPSPDSFPLEDAKRAVENRLRSSKLTYTILEPTYFMELWLSPVVGFDPANRKATIYGNGTNPVSWISYRNVADFAVFVLDCDPAHNKTLMLGGPDALSPLDVVKVFERVGGQPFEVSPVPVDALRGQYEGATDEMQKSFVGLMLALAAGRAIDMRDTLEMMPVELKSVEEYAREALGVPS